MNMRQDMDLAIKFDSIRRKLLSSGADLSRIRIALKDERTKSYITRRIMEELKEDEQ